MSNTGLIIEERSRDIGDFMVGRLIPFRKKRMVGPFIFIDHMGPSLIQDGHYMDIGQHPHIGLSTLTYLLEGEIMHRDSLGTEQLVTAGSVGWMTAGHGIVHTERSPDHQRNGGTFPIHGYQIWVALPKDKEQIDPQFSYTPGHELPEWQTDSLRFKLIAGQGFGRQSPVPVFSSLFMLKVEASNEASLQVSGELKGEIGVCVVRGHILACNERIEKGNMLVSKEEDMCHITLAKGSLVLIFGGEAFPEERYIYWNFVSSDKSVIEQAKLRWKNKQFKMVQGEKDYIPLPE
ncbi:pirin family protein [Roseivirga sp. UBA1976]|uniref:pirin family protein n=1 Tax=Roseivirga sp. UBA1976 TaxID=1947386 RepID=UPI00257B0BA5|nr:pirin family protein [Roseivirga sp. UBA1976]|tara:strand:- start:187 stop:1059 length:873 start_codon:yes stop_codon:yes gene_type:complete